ncbi:hypothetical protein EKN07_06140 [Actinobaculum sp. 352]|nr:hypothetical protein EKN07_06140 [Actinobaculum sp. 352]
MSLVPPAARSASAAQGTGQVDEMMHVLRALIEDSILSAPRSLQKLIGPSELGTPCDHCLAAKLAGWEARQDPAWLPFIGTCVHEHLERFFGSLAKAGVLESRQEARVTVGEVAGTPITGSTDLWIPDIAGPGSGGMTVDWKIVGNAKLDKVKASQHPGIQYEAQAHLYAKGWNDAGYPTRHVAVYFLPRNKFRIGDGWWWTDTYRPEIAQRALDRADRITRTLHALEDVSVDARDEWITGLARDPDCFSCSKYADWPRAANLLDQTL